MTKEMTTPDNDNAELRRYNEALAFEEAGVVRGKNKYLERFEKASLSNTATGHELKKSLLSGVEEAIAKRIEDSEARPRNLPTWLKPSHGAYIKRVSVEHLADMTLMVVMDGVNRELNERKIHELIGQAFSALVFENIMTYNTDSKRFRKRLQKKLQEKTSDTIKRIDWMNMKLDEILLANEEQIETNPRRTDHIWRKAKEWGYNREYFTENECAKIGAMLHGCLIEGANLTYTKKLKKDTDSHPTKYVFFTDQFAAFISKHKDKLADQANYFSVMLNEPKAWGLDNLGAYESLSLAKQTPVARHMSDEQKAYMDYAMRHGHFDECLTAINTIQNVPYTINEYVLSAIKWVLKENVSDDIKSFPNLTKQKHAEKLSEADFNALEKDDQIELAREAYEITKENLAAKANRSNLDAHIGEADRIMSATKSLDADNPKFWLPHNFDYRGRVYHVPTFGHHNTDYLRALFLFANKKPVKQENLKYLMLQLANTYGKDKISHDKKQDWVFKNKAAILACGSFKDSFENTEIMMDYYDFDKDGVLKKSKEQTTPFGFWSKASDPFQFLAAAHELANAMEYGEGYMSGLPVALDASQSGIQHYAASMLHANDGAKVNLTASETSDHPADLYLECLAEAKKIIADRLKDDKDHRQQNPINDNDIQAKEKLDTFLNTDATDNAKKNRRQRFNETETGAKYKRDKHIENAEQLLALDPKEWENAYGRSVIKRNNMTYAYSSRKFGFAQQLKSDWLRPLTREWRKKCQHLVKQGEDPIPHPFGKDKGFAVATWLADIHQDAIEATVESVRDGMKFFQDIAEILANATENGIHLRFVTPLNFPMYQKYRERDTRHQKVFMFDRSTPMKREDGESDTQEGQWRKDVNSYYGFYTDKIDIDKSKNGIAPNIIHSMDATHLMKTVLYCKDKGVENLMLVHDSFATNIADVEVMADAVKNAFINLYDNYCLYTDLLEQAKAQHPDPDSVTWPEVPKKGDPKLDIFAIIRSKYAFS